MKIKSLIIIFILSFTLIPNIPLEAQEIPDTRSYETVCNNGECYTVLYSGPRFIWDGNNYVDFPLDFETSTDPLYDYQTNNLGLYMAYFKEDPTEGQVVKIIKDGGEFFFQPMDLNYRNSLDQLQQIDMINPVIGSPSDNIFNYSGAYGPGIDLIFQHGEDNLKEELIIFDKFVLPSPAQYIIDGGNITLDLDFIISYSNNVDLYVEGDIWNRQNTMTTSEDIDLKIGSQTIYTIPKPISYNETNSINSYFELKRQGNSLFLNLKTDYNFINNSIGQIRLDPTIQLQDADTENLKDTWVNNLLGGGTRDLNYGTTDNMRIRNMSFALWMWRSYIEWNISQVINAVDFDAITGATLILNQTDSDLSIDRNVTSHFTNNTVWGETAVTWNNQPCGSVELQFNASCNETPSDWALVTSAGDPYSVYDWDVTLIIQNYNTSDNSVSIALVTELEGDIAEDGWFAFATKEYVATADRPKLNVTYSLTPSVFVYLTGLWFLGINSLNGNSTIILENNTARQFNNNSNAIISPNLSNDYQFWRYQLMNGTHTHFSTHTQTMTANYTITAYALEAGGGGMSNDIALFGLIILAIMLFVLVYMASKR
jgi:hypothetical protein